jgi:acetyl esterase
MPSSITKDRSRARHPGKQLIMTLDPGIEDYIAAVTRINGPAPADLPLADKRLRMERLARGMAVPHPAGLTTQNWFIPAAGREIPVRIYRPASPAPRPLLVYFHGGGWALGSLETHDYLAALLADRVGCTVVSVHYRRSPENPFPAAPDDCWEALLWAAGQAEFLGIDPSRIGVGGDSSGAHLAAGCAFRARAADGPGLCHQLLIYPALDPRCKAPSHAEHGGGPFLTRDEMIWFWEAFLGPVAASAADPVAAPALADDLSNLPPAYVLTAEIDPLRDEGEIFARRLADAGVPVVIRRGAGLVHGFMRAQPFSAVVRTETEKMCAALRQAFGA